MENNSKVWEFVEEHYPNYSSCEYIAGANDLDMLVNHFEELDEDSHAMQVYNNVTSKYVSFKHEDVITELSNILVRLNSNIYAKAISAFMEKQNP